MSDKKPEYREDDTWFSKEQHEKVTPADNAGDPRLPIPTQMVSNGEYLPHPQTEKQKRVEARINELADDASKQLNMSRRKFLATTGGIAASFIAMNEVFGRFFDVRPMDMLVPEAFAESGPPPNLFVFDTQLHTVRSSLNLDEFSLRKIAQGVPNPFNPGNLPDELGVNTPWNAALEGLPNVSENYFLVQFVKDVYLDSQVTVGLMSNNTSAAIPDLAGGRRPPKNVLESEAGELLTAPQTAACRDWLNEIAGSKRLLAHGQMFPGIPGTYANSSIPTNLEYMQWQIENLKPDSWKGYTSAASAKDDLSLDSLMRQWVLDDEVVAYPMYDLIVRNSHMLKTHPGFFNICIHKGLSTNADDGPESESLGFPTDIPRAARAWPQLNFIIYHSCIKPGFWMLDAFEDVKSGRLRDGVPDIKWTTQFAIESADLKNVYAELGTTFASCVITFPTVCAHILGQLLKYFGEDRVVWGSDSVWYGSPQWQIEALWRFEIPEDMRRKYGYPRLSKAIKRKILGLNSARLYDLPGLGKVGQHGDGDDRHHGHSRRHGHGHGRGQFYQPVPGDYENRIPDSLKTLMEFPGFTDDNMAALKKIYAEAGGTPSNTRYGWLRTRA